MTCERRCTRKSMTKSEYKKRKNNGEKLSTVECCGCHKTVICDENAIQYYDIEGIFYNE